MTDLGETCEHAVPLNLNLNIHLRATSVQVIV